MTGDVTFTNCNIYSNRAVSRSVRALALPGCFLHRPHGGTFKEVVPDVICCVFRVVAWPSVVVKSLSTTATSIAIMQSGVVVCSSVSLVKSLSLAATSSRTRLYMCSCPSRTFPSSPQWKKVLNGMLGNYLCACSVCAECECLPIELPRQFLHRPHGGTFQDSFTYLLVCAGWWCWW